MDTISGRFRNLARTCALVCAGIAGIAGLNGLTSASAQSPRCDAILALMNQTTNPAILAALQAQYNAACVTSTTSAPTTSSSTTTSSSHQHVLHQHLVDHVHDAVGRAVPGHPQQDRRGHRSGRNRRLAGLLRPGGVPPPQTSTSSTSSPADAPAPRRRPVDLHVAPARPPRRPPPRRPSRTRRAGCSPTRSPTPPTRQPSPTCRPSTTGTGATTPDDLTAPGAPSGPALAAGSVGSQWPASWWPGG